MAADRSGVGDHGIVLQRAREMGIYALPWPFFFPPLSFPSATLLRYPRYVRLSRQLFPSFFRAFVSSLRFFFFCFGRAPPTPAPQRMSPLLLVGRCISSGKLPLGLQAFPFGFLGVLGELSSSPPNLVPGVSIFFLPFFSRRQPWGKRNAA